MTKEEIAQALKDKDAGVRWEAAKHPNASQEHLTTALKDEDAGVRRAAKENLARAISKEVREFVG